MRALGSFGVASHRKAARPPVLGAFTVGPTTQYGVQPAHFDRLSIGSGTTPALTGLFRNGRRTVGISQINAMATNVRRGSG